MRKVILVPLVLLLVSCSAVDEYGVKESNYENIIHCELTDATDNYSITYIEQLYGNDGVIDYVYSEQLQIFQNKDLISNVENVEEEKYDGYSVSVKVDQKNGAIDTITRIDYTKLNYRELLENDTDESYSKAEAEMEEKIARDMSVVPMDYCRIIK